MWNVPGFPASEAGCWLVWDAHAPLTCTPAHAPNWSLLSALLGACSGAEHHAPGPAASCRHESAEAVVAAMQGGHSGATVDSITQLVEELSRLH